MSSILEHKLQDPDQSESGIHTCVQRVSFSWAPSSHSRAQSFRTETKGVGWCAFWLEKFYFLIAAWCCHMCIFTTSVACSNYRESGCIIMYRNSKKVTKNKTVCLRREWVLCHWCVPVLSRKLGKNSGENVQDMGVGPDLKAPLNPQIPYHVSLKTLLLLEPLYDSTS